MGANQAILNVDIRVYINKMAYINNTAYSYRYPLTVLFLMVGNNQINRAGMVEEKKEWRKV